MCINANHHRHDDNNCQLIYTNILGLSEFSVHRDKICCNKGRDKDYKFKKVYLNDS
jgi:hypothetical protein